MYFDCTFSLHDFVSFRISERQSLFDRLLARPGRGYSQHIVQYGQNFLQDVDIDIRIAPFIYQNRDASEVDRKFYVDRNYFACEDTSKILRWKLEIDGFENDNPCQVKIDKNVFGSAALGSRIIDCLIRYYLNLRQAPAVHGCGVVVPKGAVLFVGASGVGKSSIAMRMLEFGVPLLGDNWIIVNQGEAFGFHLPINIHDYNVPMGIYRRLPLHVHINILFKKYIRMFTAGYLKKSYPLLLKKMYPKLIAERSPIFRMVSLIQGDSYNARKIKRSDLVQRMLATDMMDREAFYRYMLAYSTRYPESTVGTHWERLKTNLESALPPDMEIYELTLPKKITSQILDRIMEFIK